VLLYVIAAGVRSWIELYWILAIHVPVFILH